MKDKFYITTAIDYVNSVPHLGHALEKVQADAIARYQRITDKDVYFLTGVDEHGIKIIRSSQDAGKSVKDFVNENSGKFAELTKKLDISNNNFIRTSDRERHWPGAQLLWKKLVEAGDIYKGKYSGYYCVGCEAYVTEKDLIDGKCPYHFKEPEKIEEENYFFKLSRYVDEIKNKIESGELKILPESRKNEILGMIKEGVGDISFSRPKEKLSDWGVPVPDDESQLMYVWCDALANYISALGYGSNNEDNLKKFWPADLHIIGKDILRFHALIWPAMLMSAKLLLPKTIFVHGFILSNGKRMSKTLGNVIDPFYLAEKYGVDATRYYLLREITPFEDGDITEEKFKEAYNANLANGLGNLTARIMKMSEQYLDNKELRIKNYELPNDFKNLMDNFGLNKAMDLIWEKISELDLHIQKTEPFKLIKTDEKKAKEILVELVLGLQNIALMLKPFLPQASEKILKSIELNKMPETLFPRV
ncbi:methionine--tRNA ligase [Candidatus Wolfebacteria bacterium CG_4_10_14_0_8_um_filter_37_11]|uniref:methionine--tRNA ligase n=3 Tax=Candidatus Wolfeibacteriota TaxID=1752735 RepID=A0A2M7Q7B7_9BACT|nr:MAG: methionine--tRNA ligase [Candidatus Wolfebacteria bacterium CG_4_10_14_0_8_um_filter_37_11]PJA41605.1 MAG: methionine--tRNA ligase [Candidatus Wolfebacteria bacterium CG_4_9_14_3_um_filter_37_9]